MSGWIPTPIRNVKPFVAVVQPGDSVSRIAKRLTGNPNRWPELVGANLHKPLSTGAVAGSPYRVFDSLAVGEPLMVPALWPNPDAGLVGKAFSGGYINETNPNTQPSNNPDCKHKSCSQLEVACGVVDDGCGKKIDCGPCFEGAGGNDPIAVAITTILAGMPPGTVQPPPGFGIPDVTKVIQSWWPYLPGMIPPGMLPPTLTPPNPAIPGSFDFWLMLVQSASAFLAAAGLTPAQIDALFAIPWTAVPWDKIPWQQLVMAMDSASKNPFWQMLFKSASGTPWTQKPAMNTGTGFQVNLLDSSAWTKEPFKGVSAFGWQNVPWTSAVDPTIWGKIDDTELLGCIAGNPARAAELAKHADCFKSDMGKLKQYMCNPQLDVTKCASAKVDPVIPTVPPGVNWACAPSPQCLADQFKALGIPDPCSPMPTCIPQWYKTITGQSVPATKDEKKTEANLPLYVGLGAAGIALVAGILVMAAAD